MKKNDVQAKINNEDYELIGDGIGCGFTTIALICLLSVAGCSAAKIFSKNDKQNTKTEQIAKNKTITPTNIIAYNNSLEY